MSAAAPPACARSNGASNSRCPGKSPSLREVRGRKAFFARAVGLPITSARRATPRAVREALLGCPESPASSALRRSRSGSRDRCRPYRSAVEFSRGSDRFPGSPRWCRRRIQCAAPSYPHTRETLRRCRRVPGKCPDKNRSRCADTGYRRVSAASGHAVSLFLLQDKPSDRSRPRGNPSHKCKRRSPRSRCRAAPTAPW